MTAPQSVELTLAGPRVYSIEQANALVPNFEQAFEKLDELRAQLRSAKIKLTAIEMIWGDKVNSRNCPDHEEGASLVNQLKELEERFQAVLSELAEHSASVKDMDLGLVDLFHVRDGRLVHLCWKRGEKEFVAWHHVDEGYADRHAL